MENEGYVPSFGQNEELEFDIHEYAGKRRPINITGPGGAPLKGIFFRDQPLKEAKKQKTEKQKTKLLKILLAPFSGIHAFIHRVKRTGNIQ